MKNDDLLYVLPASAVSIFSAITKIPQIPLFESRENILRSYYEGLYHITTDEAADKIIKSKELHASGRFTSYSIHKRCFFFAGIPDFENVCLNVSAKQTLTAIRLKLPYERLAEFDRRAMNDGAITYKNDLNLEGAIVEKIRLGLKEKNGNLCYEQISEEEYQNYKLNLSEEKLKIVNNNMAFKLRSFCAGLRREYDIFKQNFKNAIRDERSNIEINTRKDYIEKNSDLFEHTQELPIIQIESEQTSAIDMFKSFVEPDNENYRIGNIYTNDKNDVKAELLKVIISSSVYSLNKGIPINNKNNVVTPGMSDKDISDVLYTNMCNGKIDECFNLLDNPVVLFSTCKNYVQEKNAELTRKDDRDPRIEILSQEIDSFSSNLKNGSISQGAY